MSSERLLLAIYIFTFGLGGVLIGSLTLQRLRSQIALALVIALACYGLFHSGENVSDLLHTPGGDLVAFPVIALGWLALSKGVFGASFMKDWREMIGRALQPRYWSQPVTPATSLETAKRWFVAIAASTGSLVLSLASDNDFVQLLTDAFRPGRIVITAIITIVSVVLIGPMEEYVFGAALRDANAGRHEAPEAGEHTSHFERLLQNMSLRALGRVGLVLGLIFLLNVTHACVEEKLKEGDTQTMVQIVLATLGPGVVTYFWCASLQRSSAKLVTTSTAGSLVAGMLLYTPGCLVLSFLIVATTTHGNGGPALVGEMLLIFIAMALFLGGVTNALPAFAGGLMLQAERRRATSAPTRTIALMMAAIALLTAAMIFVLMLVLRVIDPGYAEQAKPEDLYFPGIASALGWGLGLFVSGFPGVLKRAAPLGEAAAAATATATPTPPAGAEPNSPPARFFEGQPPGI